MQQGRILGELLVPADQSPIPPPVPETLIHLGLYKNNQAICPDTFFTPDAKNAIIAELNAYFGRPDCLMCC